MRRLMAVLVLAALPAACASQPAAAPALTPDIQQTETAAILAMLGAQDAAWNRGDIPAFMSGYWNSPELRFASGGTIARGWQATLDRYETKYDSPEKMGTLLTSDHEIIFLAPDAAVAHGRWQLEREGDAPSGLYTLVLRKIDGAWRIISDTTTSAD